MKVTEKKGKVFIDNIDVIDLIEKLTKENDKLSEELNNIKKAILNETTTHCKTCPSRMCCNEENCVVYRLEKLGLDNEKR
jgi:predicted aldo/keto reductase-like oxidoreductase